MVKKADCSQTFPLVGGYKKRRSNLLRRIYFPLIVRNQIRLMMVVLHSGQFFSGYFFLGWLYLALCKNE